MINIKRIITLLCLLMISLLVISACDSGSGRGGSLTVITPAEKSLSDIINGGVIITNDNGTITIVITNEDGEKEIVAYIYIDEKSGTISIEVDGEVMGYIDEDGYITDTDSNIIGYVDDNSTIVISILTNNDIETGTEEDNGENEENTTITLDPDVLSAFAEEFINHFKAGGSSIDSTDENTIANIEYILTALADKGVDNITSVGLVSSFGRIVAEEVSDSETCNEENSSLGCTLVDIISGNSSSFQGYLNIFLNKIGQSLFPKYYDNLTNITSNLTNLNSQSDNISSLADALETIASARGSAHQEILNQLSYIASYATYVTTQIYCNLSGVNCTHRRRATGYFKIYTDDENQVIIGYCGDGTNYGFVNGNCDRYEPVTYILDQQAIIDADNFADEMDNGWSLGDNYDNTSTYIALYENLGNIIIETCNKIVDYGNSYVSGYSQSNTCSMSTMPSHLSPTNELGWLQDYFQYYVYDTFHNIIYGNRYSSISNLAYLIYNRLLYYICYNVIYGLYNNVQQGSSTNYQNIANFLHDYGYSYTNSNAPDIYKNYYQPLDEAEVNTIGQRNIYYFITEFINGLDNEGEESYLSGYEFKDEYTSKTLPDDMKSTESEENDFYYNLSLAFTTETSGVSVDTLNTQNTNGDNSTTGFTESTIESILSSTKEDVISVLKDYEVIEEKEDEEEILEEESGT